MKQSSNKIIAPIPPDISIPCLRIISEQFDIKKMEYKKEKEALEEHTRLIALMETKRGKICEYKRSSV